MIETFFSRFVIRYGGEDVPQSPVHFVVKDDSVDGVEDAEAGPYRLSGQGIQRAQVSSVATNKLIQIRIQGTLVCWEGGFMID